MSTTPRYIGKYELSQQLGRGSTGEVWKGYDTQSHRDVAVKLIHTDLQSDPNFMTRFTREGQLLTSLQHPNIVPILEANIARSQQSNETTAFLAMDYIEGKTLADYIQTLSYKNMLPSTNQIVYLFTSLGVAIDYAHQHGIIHGNIKPGNILLNRHNTTYFEAGEPLLTDFGLTQLSNNTMVASPYYMSPEQARGLPANNRSDIYSLGIILYELCTGGPPFRDDSSVAVMMQHINNLPTPPNLINPNVPPALSEVILRAMSKDTATRYSMASLLATAIADACSLQTVLRIPNERLITSEEDDAAYGIPNNNTGSILGVSQPSQKIPARQSFSQPLPRVSRPLPVNFNNSQPLPRVSRPLPAPSNQTPRTYPGTPMPAPRTIIPTPVERSPIISPMQQMTESSPTFTQKNRTPAFSSSMKTPVPPIPPTPQESMNPTPRPFTKKRPARLVDNYMYVIFTILALLLLVIIGTIGANALFNSNTPKATAQTAAGHIFFQDDALGHSDIAHIDMQNVAAPASGQNYFLWLHNTNGQTLLLGQLPWQNGSISYTYPGNATHSNLLALTQSFSITEEKNNNPPAPTGHNVFQATFDAATFPLIQNILNTTPGLPGNQSVVVGLLNALKSMNDKTDSINDSLTAKRDFALVQRQAARIIESVDNTRYAVSSHDLPPQDQPQTNTLTGLLSSPTQQGYLDTLATQLTLVKQAAQGNSALLQHIQNVQNALQDLQTWVQKIHDYDVQILKAANLADPAIASIALQLKQTAADAYTGHTIAPASAPQPILGSAGALQAYTEAQYMATLDVKPL